MEISLCQTNDSITPVKVNCYGKGTKYPKFWVGATQNLESSDTLHCHTIKTVETSFSIDTESIVFGKV